MPIQDYPPARSPDWYARISAPLVLSLRRLNKERPSIRAIERFAREAQRPGPWDLVDYVQRESYGNYEDCSDNGFYDETVFQY
jgi:hypothetical protein